MSLSSLLSIAARRLTGLSFIVLLGLPLLVSARALTVTQDLGEGLRYFRPEKVGLELPSPATAAGLRVLIIDLRGKAPDLPELGSFSGWLHARNAASVPAVVLINADSSSKLQRLLSESEWPSLLTIAPVGTEYEFDIPVDTSTESDRKACEAIDRGDALKGLITTQVTKERLDEAKLAKSYENSPRTANRDLEEPKKAQTGTTPESSPVAADLVLARAVQLHRAMLALHVLR